MFKTLRKDDKNIIASDIRFFLKVQKSFFAIFTPTMRKLVGTGYFPRNPDPYNIGMVGRTSEKCLPLSSFTKCYIYII